MILIKIVKYLMVVHRKKLMELGIEQNAKRNLTSYHKLLIVENIWLVGGMLMKKFVLIIVKIMKCAVLMLFLNFQGVKQTVLKRNAKDLVNSVWINSQKNVRKMCV